VPLLPSRPSRISDGRLPLCPYDDGSLGELFIHDVGKEGSTLRGVLAMFAMATSVALQYGAPPEVVSRKLTLMDAAARCSARGRIRHDTDAVIPAVREHELPVPGQFVAPQKVVPERVAPGLVQQVKPSFP
jgi:hypothetical protein